MGLIITALALALVIAAVVVRVTLGSEPELVVAAEVATKSVDEVSRYSSGEEGSATKKSGSGEAHGDVADLQPYPTFEKLKVYARKVPYPRRAAELIEEYGAPPEISDVTLGKVPMVPPGTEEDR